MAHYEPATTIEDIHALNNIATKLFRQVSKNAPANTNVILSPTGVFLSLYETYLGSSGKAREELLNLFDVDPSRLTSLLADVQHLNQEGHPSKNIRDRHFDLFGGSKFVVDRNAAIRLDSTFAEQLKNITGEPAVEQIDLGNLAAAVDQLSASLTEKRISGPDAIPREVSKEEDRDLDGLAKKVAKDSSSMLLFSALHFYSEWENKFLARSSTNYHGRSRETVVGLTGTVEDFRNADGNSMPAIMLHLQDKVFYAHDENLEVTIVELPLSHYDMNLTIVLPDDEKHGLKKFEDNFGPDTLEILRKNWQMPSTHVYFPKFKLESHLILGKALQSLGLKSMFTDKAELPGFGGVHVAEAVHVAGIEISAEAAKPLPKREPRAGECSVMELDKYPQAFRVNRPFMFFVTARHPEIWCLMGKVVDLPPELEHRVDRHHKRTGETYG